MHQGENYQDFFKFRGLFLGHLLIIIKLTLRVFSQNLQFDPPTIRDKIPFFATFSLKALYRKSRHKLP